MHVQVTYTAPVVQPDGSEGHSQEVVASIEIDDTATVTGVTIGTTSYQAVAPA